MLESGSRDERIGDSRPGYPPDSTGSFGYRSVDRNLRERREQNLKLTFIIARSCEQLATRDR